MNGSSGICPTIESIFDIASPWAPPIMEARLVPIDDPSWKCRLDFRSLKKVFQSRRWSGEGLADVLVLVDAGAVAVELYRIIEREEERIGEFFLMGTLRRTVDALGDSTFGEDVA